MNRLLLSDTFDGWGFQGAEIVALTQYSVSGTLNTRYLTESERASHPDEMLRYSEVRGILSAIVKAGRTPSLMKMVLVCPKDLLEDHRSVAAKSYLMTLHFQDGVLRLTGGISLGSFSMDRSDAQFWDLQFPRILQKLQIEYTTKE